MWSAGSITKRDGSVLTFLVRTASPTQPSSPRRRPQHSVGAASRACRTTSTMTPARIFSTSPFTSALLPPSLLPSAFSLQTFYHHGYSHAAADAERRDAVTCLSRAQRIDQRRQHPRAAGADRMTESDRPAVHIHLRGIDAELPAHGDHLRGKRLIQL